MVEKDVNFSCVLYHDVDELHFLMEALNGEIHDIGQRPWILSFNLYKII